MSNHDGSASDAAKATEPLPTVERDRWIEQPDAFATDVTRRLDRRFIDDCGKVCLVVVKGNELTRRYKVKTPLTTIGRGEEADVQLAAGGVSRLHAEIRKETDGYVITDLESTNGVFVNDSRVSCHTVRNGDKIRLGDTTLRFIISTRLDAEYHDEIYRLTTTDEATGTYNRRYFFETLEREVARATRHQRPLTMLMIDVDGFAAINNAWGYLVGDSLLVQIASRIRASCRIEDVFARFGGQEFCLMLPETTPDGGRILAERLRRLIEVRPFIHDEDTVTLTVSIGVAAIEEVDVPGEPLEETNRRLDLLIRLAIQKLERAKLKGGNATIV